MVDESRRVVGNLIRKRRIGLGLSQEDLAASIEKSQRYISKIETGTVKMPRDEMLQLIGDKLGLTLTDFYAARGLLPTPEPEPEPEAAPPPRVLREGYAVQPQPLMPYAIPVYDQEVGAGKGEPVIQQYLYMGPDDGIPSDWFGVPVRGECMVPVLFPRDVVVVDPNAEPRNGDIVVFDLEHEKALVKWFAKRKSGIYFEPEHGERIRYDEGTMRIVGVVKRTWRDPSRIARREWRDVMARHYKQMPDDPEEDRAQ